MLVIALLNMILEIIYTKGYNVIDYILGGSYE